MSARDEVIGGGRLLDDLLATLPAKVHANILRAALSAGAQVFKAEALREVPRDTGALAKSIRVTSRNNVRGGTVSASVKAGGKRAPYAQNVEFGTRAHTIAAGEGHALNVNGNEYRVVHHPGARQKPFMRPVADRAYVVAIAAVKRKIRERLTQQGLNAPEVMPADPAE